MVAVEKNFRNIVGNEVSTVNYRISSKIVINFRNIATSVVDTVVVKVLDRGEKNHKEDDVI